MMSLASLRKRLALPKTSWQLCLLATLGGVFSALLIVLFTLSIEALQDFYLHQKDNYTSLDALSRFDLPIIGALLILFFAWLTGYKYLRTGIPLVLHRLKVAHGVMPLKNTLNQFVGSAIALASGFSVGREGPAVHLGAACSSYLGSLLKLPYNSMRTLCACGIAAGISASFNTPVAAVLFVMEVILREYKIHIFIPIMLSAIVGSLITSHVFGPAHEFEYFDKIALTFQHYPLLIILGAFLGLLAFAFNRYLILIIDYSKKFHIVPRLLLAAFITGALGSTIPYAMGTGISAIDFSLANHWQFQLLFGLLIAKFIMTITALGLGIPGGIVGPILGIGAIAGTCASIIAVKFMPGAQLASDFALMGMAGFMAATLNAPLAALLAVIELSNQLEIMVPAMIVIASASVVSGQFCKNRSIFVMQLDLQKLTYRKSPIEQPLHGIGVLGVMKENITIIESNDDGVDEKLSLYSSLDDQQNYQIIKLSKPSQLTKEQSPQPSTYYWFEDIEFDTTNEIEKNKTVRHQLIPLSSQATLAEAYNALVAQRNGAVYIYQDNPENIIGVVLFEQIRHYLLEGKMN